jgi:hypothetical protein
VKAERAEMERGMILMRRVKWTRRNRRFMSWIEDSWVGEQFGEDSRLTEGDRKELWKDGIGCKGDTQAYWETSRQILA